MGSQPQSSPYVVKVCAYVLKYQGSVRDLAAPTDLAVKKPLVPSAFTPTVKRLPVNGGGGGYENPARPILVRIIMGQSSLGRGAVASLFALIFQAVALLPLVFFSFAALPINVALCVPQIEKILYGLVLNKSDDFLSTRRNRPLIRIAILVASLLVAPLYVLQFYLDLLLVFLSYFCFEFADVLCCGSLVARTPSVQPLQRLLDLISKPPPPHFIGMSEEEREAARLRHVGHASVWGIAAATQSCPCSWNDPRLHRTGALQCGSGVVPAKRDLRLLRFSWLLELGTEGTAVNEEYGGVLPRRQVEEV